MGSERGEANTCGGAVPGGCLMKCLNEISDFIRTV